MVIIVEITPLRTGLQIRLDSGKTVRLTRKDAEEGGFREGMSFSDADFDQFVRLHQYPRALNQAVAMLARRPCSRHEIESRLRRTRYEEEIIGLVLYKLEKERLLNDAEFADSWVQYRASGRYGERRILQELKQKGISDDIAREAVGKLDESAALDNAVRLAAKALQRTRPGENRWAVRNRVLAALVRRGFSWDTASKAYEIALNHN